MLTIVMFATELEFNERHFGFGLNMRREMCAPGKISSIGLLKLGGKVYSKFTLDAYDKTLKPNIISTLSRIF